MRAYRAKKKKKAGMSVDSLLEEAKALSRCHDARFRKLRLELEYRPPGAEADSLREQVERSSDASWQWDLAVAALEALARRHEEERTE